jgi:hypothetical protein
MLEKSFLHFMYLLKVFATQLLNNLFILKFKIHHVSF